MATPIQLRLGDVVVMEDDVAVGNTIAKNLRDAGFSPIVATTLNQARTLLEQGNPRVLIVDIGLSPGTGANAVDAIRDIRLEHQDLPIIGYSNFHEDRTFPELAGIDAFLPKLEAVQNDAIKLVEQVLLSRATDAEVLYHGPDDAQLETIKPDLVFVDRRLMQQLAKHPADLHLLDPREFEEVIAEIWAGAGFSVKLTPRSKDGGKDIYAVTNEGFGDLLYIIECKKYKSDNPVTVEIVRALYGVTEGEKVTMGLIATTSYFTGPAREFQKRMAPYRLTLRDFKGVSEWLADYPKRPR